jgi:hypothetical protein
MPIFGAVCACKNPHGTRVAVPNVPGLDGARPLTHVGHLVVIGGVEEAEKRGDRLSRSKWAGKAPASGVGLAARRLGGDPDQSDGARR